MNAAIVLLVFGHAHAPASLARVLAAADYVQTNTAAFQAAPAPRIVFSGCREGDLMLRAARSLELHRYAQLRAETRSCSTVENLIHTVEDGLLDGYEFSPQQPLGLVSHSWHLPRVRLLAGRVLRLRGAALTDIPATGAPPTWWSEPSARVLCRLCLLGAQDARRLLSAERWMLAGRRRRYRV